MPKRWCWERKIRNAVSCKNVHFWFKHILFISLRFDSVNRKALQLYMVAILARVFKNYAWLYSRILTYHQVMPAYLDFLSVFGSDIHPRDLRFSDFPEQTLLSNTPRGVVAPELGRSGRQFQMCYNIKSVVRKSTTEESYREQQWAIRQAAVHHQFDVVEGTTLWILTKTDLDFRENVQEITGKHGRPEDRAFNSVQECFKSSLVIHLMCWNWATQEWRWYIQWLEGALDEEASPTYPLEIWKYTKVPGLDPGCGL